MSKRRIGDALEDEEVPPFSPQDNVGQQPIPRDSNSPGKRKLKKRTLDIEDSGTLFALPEGIPPHTPPLRLSQATNSVQASTKVEVDSPTLVIPLKTTFQDLCQTIKTKISEDATVGKCEFTENTSNTSEVILKPPKGNEVKIKHNGDNAICTFTGSEGMEQATKVLLDSFIASGQTELTIGGSDPKMVLILATLVADKLKTNSELKVNLDPAARTILAADSNNSELIKDLDKTKLDVPKASTARP